MSVLRQVRRASCLFRQCQLQQLASFQISRNYADQMSFTFASPSDVYYNNVTVKQVDVPGLVSHFGILANHVPTLAVLKPGVVKVYHEDGEDKRYFVSSGSVTVNADSTVSILAEEAHPLDRLDPSAIREGLTKAQQALGAAQTEQDKAKAEVAVECFEALSKSLE